MKYSVKNKKEGERIKGIVKTIAEAFPYVTEGDVMNVFGYTPAPEAHSYGWPSEHILNGKMQVRKVKDTWFLYIFGKPEKLDPADDYEEPELPDVDICVFETEVFEKLVKAIDDGFTKLLECEQRTTDQTLEYLYDSIIPSFFFCTRPCIIKAAKSGPKEKRKDRKAKFHRWADLSKGVQQVVAIVEFGDGHIEQVQPDRVIFKEEE